MVNATARDQREEGRTASAETLSNCLAEAPGPFLEGALENPALTQDLIRIPVVPIRAQIVRISRGVVIRQLTLSALIHPLAILAAMV